MSLNNTFRYKNFEVYTLLTGVFGGGGYYKQVNIYAYRTASDVVYDNNLNHGGGHQIMQVINTLELVILTVDIRLFKIELL